MGVVAASHPILARRRRRSFYGRNHGPSIPDVPGEESGDRHKDQGARPRSEEVEESEWLDERLDPLCISRTEAQGRGR